MTFEGCLSGDGAGVVLREVTCGHIKDGLFPRSEIFCVFCSNSRLLIFFFSLTTSSLSCLILK